MVEFCDFRNKLTLASSPLRKKVAANAQKRPKTSIPPDAQDSRNKVERVSLTWAKLIARIYEVNPLLCQCGKEIKITSFVLHPEEIRKALRRIGWPTKIPEFDPPYNLHDRGICQLLSSDLLTPSQEKLKIDDLI